MPTLNWELFKQTYARPVINDVLNESIDDETLQALAYATIVDMQAKGIETIGPAPSSISYPATPQINYITPGNFINTGNIFYLSIGNQSESYTSLANETLENIVSKLKILIDNSSQTNFQDLVTTNQTFRLKIEGAPGIAFDLKTATARGSAGASNNPSLDVTLGKAAEASTQSIQKLSNLTCTFSEGFNVLAFGIKYFLISDPISSINTAAGVNISINSNLIALAKSDYYNALLGCIEANSIVNNKANYWKSRLVSNLASDTSALTYEERLALLNAEYNRKIEQDDNQILDSGSQNRLNQNNNTRNQKSLLHLKKQFDLEKEFKNLNNKQASNGYWTPSGQVTITYLSEYFVEPENTIQVDLLGAPNSYFGLPYEVNNTESLMGAPIETLNYKKLELGLNADNPIQFKFFSSVDGNTYTQVGNTTLNNNFNKLYYLPPSKFIKLEVVGTINNTNFYIEGNFRA